MRVQELVVMCNFACAGGERGGGRGGGWSRAAYVGSLYIHNTGNHINLAHFGTSNLG